MYILQFQEIYRIKLPGSPTVVGEGKPENQNHAMIFTRGEALQTIDMNQVGKVLLFFTFRPAPFSQIRKKNIKWNLYFTGPIVQTLASLCIFFFFLLQDNYFEEAFKMRNVLEEFLKTHHGQRMPTILGLREHIFTGRLVFDKYVSQCWNNICLDNIVLSCAYFSL